MLNLLRNGEVIRQVVPGSSFTYGLDTTSPAYAGWDNGEYELVEAPPAPEPEPPTPEELRALMPPLTSRQFWLAANTLGITEDLLVAATDDTEVIIEIRKSTEFHRMYDSVVMLAPLMGITPEQLDDVWMWAAAV